MKQLDLIPWTSEEIHAREARWLRRMAAEAAERPDGHIFTLADHHERAARYYALNMDINERYGALDIDMSEGRDPRRVVWHRLAALDCDRTYLMTLDKEWRELEAMQPPDLSAYALYREPYVSGVLL